MTTLSIHIALILFEKKTVLNYHRLKRIIYDEHLKHLLDGRQQKEKGQAKNKMAKNSRERV